MRIQHSLLYSLCLNAVLGTALIHKECSTAHHGEKASIFDTSPQIAQTPVPEPTPTSCNKQKSVEPFHWSSLESDDYPTYIANLRKIGCPESTIRDIISAEIDAIYAQKRATTRQQSLAALQEEELRLLTQLLDGSSSSAEYAPQQMASETPAAATSATQPPQLSTSDSPSSAIPLAFHAPQTAGIKLNKQQEELLENLRQSFVEEIGGTNQNPDDPAYLKRWQKATRDSNALLEAYLGTELYARYQTKTASPSGQ